MKPRDDVEIKSVGPLTLEEGEKGEVTALVSTLNTVDRDRDVMLPGSIRNGAKVKMSAYNHSIFTEGSAPVGMGIIDVEGDRAVFRGHFFLNTQRGREAYETAKALGTDSEWSIGWRKASAKTSPMTDGWRAKGARNLYSAVEPLEVSPVIIGASPNTQTVTVKEVEDEAARIQADAEAKVAEEVAEIEAKAAKDAVELKALGSTVMKEFWRTRRSLQRMGLA